MTKSAVLVALVLAGCATSKHWARVNTSAEQFHRDSYQCAMEARQPRWEWGRFANVKDKDMVNKELYRACLASRGYQRIDGGPWVGLHD